MLIGAGKDRMIFGDVGWSKQEELSLIAPNGGGSNYGWRYWQGDFCHDEDNCDNIGKSVCLSLAINLICTGNSRLFLAMDNLFNFYIRI